MTSTVHIPWGAWYEETQLELVFPDSCKIDVLSPEGAAKLEPDELVAAIDHPVAGPTLTELATGKQSACLVVDDLARPTQASEILLPILERLHDSGIKKDRIDIVIATGSHGSLSEEEASWKVGADIAHQYRVQSHNCRSNLAGTGVMYGDQELQLNRTFLEAGVKVAIGSVLPHSFAGYSGGAKLMLPGLADLTSISRSHKFVQLGLRGGADPNENRFRTEAENIARQMGLEFIVCAVTNAARETVGLHAGDVVEAHRSACRQARDVFSTPLDKTYDCAVLNAYPKDCDLVQAANAFVAWKGLRRPVVKDEGVVALATAASHGVGKHGLFDPNGVSFQPPRALRHLRGRDLWLLTPNMPREQVHKLYWEGYPVFHSVNELRSALADRFPHHADVAVFPCAPTQQVDDRRQTAGQP